MQEGFSPPTIRCLRCHMPGPSQSHPRWQLATFSSARREQGSDLHRIWTAHLSIGVRGDAAECWLGIGSVFPVSVADR
jgi:hypothetical protein